MTRTTDNFTPLTSRREMLGRLGTGLGMLAFSELFSSARCLARTGDSGGLHLPARARNVIFFLANGGVSQVDTFDPKPALDRLHGKPMPGGAPQTENRTGVLMRSPFEFRQHGQSGLEISELFPHLARHADDLCMIRSMTTDIPNHEPSLLQLLTGHTQVGRPSMGSWLTYGLGTENRNLPGYVVLCPDRPSTVGAPMWGSAFLPASHQGALVKCRVPRREKDFDPHRLIPDLQPPQGSKPGRQVHDFTRQLDRRQIARNCGDQRLVEDAIEAMETAFRMQTEAPEVFDIRQEDASTMEMYGEGHLARGCLMARRLVERGVRMVQIIQGTGDPWDAHFDILEHRRTARDCDRPIAALLEDLKRSGLWEETLVVFATEFGRTPVMETGGGPPSGRVTNGRDHNPYGFSVWLAGAGVKKGYVHGATDDFGFRSVQDPVHVHDLQATLLHLMGIDHEKLTYEYSGRRFRLTDVGGRVVQNVLA